ncbi:papain cysteine protease family protein [Brevibacillus laterosporus GI-9]|uniref:C1 family peptidase n=1 Tax=Brevibacillus laterosporus TaxID=1465 RepID=UPI000240550A|nr:C1 family peptidase [Brevibacillus laterosporus]CCF17082.1 papain cysteine protease family protein [Brevibacillus laterosporus GI-9]
MGKITFEQISNSLSNSGNPWEAEWTSLSSLSLEEQKKHLGATPHPDAPSIEEIEKRIPLLKESLMAEVPTTIGVPTNYDLRNVGGKNFVTPIKYQKNCGSCVAFGTIATVESTLRVQRNDPNLSVDLSEAHLFFCHGRDDGASCASGWWPHRALEAFKNKGVVDEECYKYDDGLTRQDCSGLCSNSGSREVKITGYTDLTGKPSQIKEWVSSKGPVSACLIVYEDLFSYRNGIYRHMTGQRVGGHCVSIVGYNDSEGYWICKNSWNSTWGEQGFFRIAYTECGIDSWANHGVDGI